MKVVRPALTIKNLPAPPARAGYAFTGWNINANGSGAVFNEKTAVNARITVYAQWQLVPANSYLVTFNRNGGDTDAQPPLKVVTPPASSIDALPASPARAGYAFGGWNTEANGTGSFFTAATPVSAAITVYAQWHAVSGEGIVVVFDKNGGDTEANPATKTINPPATTVGELPAPPSRAGFIFTGWNTSPAEDGDRFDETSTVTESIVVYADWMAVPVQDAILALYKNNAEVAGVTNTETLVNWLIKPGNLVSNAQYRIVLKSDCTVSAAYALNGPLNNIVITVEGDGVQTRTIKLSGPGWLSIASGFTLRLGSGLRIRGANAAEDGVDNQYPLFIIAGGNLIMESGSEISGNVNRTDSGNAFGGAVYLESGSFTMNGGLIKDNNAIADSGFAAYGGGVFVYGGQFSMKGDAHIDANNSVCLYLESITVNGALTGTPPVALIDPWNYNEGKTILSGTAVTSEYGKFQLMPNETEQCTIDSQGKLAAPRYPVSGTITLSGGSGDVTQAAVQLSQYGNAVGTAVYPAADGTYTVQARIGEGYTVSAALAGYTTQTIGSFAVNAPGLTGKDISLPVQTHTVSGTVTLNGGTGNVTQASVALQQGGAAIATVNPAANGAYSFANVPSGSGYTVKATLAGYADGSVTAFDVYSSIGGKNLSLNFSGYTISGTVTLNGGAGDLTQAAVELRRNSTLIHTTTPDSGGNYSFTGVSANSGYVISAALAGYQSASTAAFPVTGADISGKDVTLSLMSQISGTVSLYGGGTLDLSTVTIVLGNSVNQYLKTGTVDAAGNYLIQDVPPGSDYRVRVSPNDSGFASDTSAVFAVNGSVSGVDLTLRKYWSVSGTISLNGGSGDRTQTRLNLARNGEAVFSGRTGAVQSNGSYTISGVPAHNDYTVSANLAGFSEGVSASFNVGAGNASGINLTLAYIPQRYTVSGTVTLDPPDGDVNATVQLRQGPGYGLLVEEITSAANGTYSFTNVAEGDNYYIYFVRRDKYRQVYNNDYSGTFSVNGPVAKNFTLTPTIVTGTVQDADGNPLPNATVQLWRRDSLPASIPTNPVTMDRRIDVYETASADANGIFTFSKVPNRNFDSRFPGGYVAVISLAGYGTGEVKFSVFFGRVINSESGDLGTITLAPPTAFLYTGYGAGETLVAPFAYLANALNWLKTTAQDNTTYTIRMSANQSTQPNFNSQVSTRYGFGRANMTVVFASTGPAIGISLPFYLGEQSDSSDNIGLTLILENNITLKGQSGYASAVTVGNGYTLVMKDGSAISRDNSYNGSSDGGGVHVAANGTFTMEGGLISGNRANYRSDFGAGGNGGGVFVDRQGSFTKTGGTITGYASDQFTGNRASGSDSSDIYGHAVWIDSGQRNGNLKINPFRRKETTSGPGDNLSYSYNSGSPAATGSWDN